MSEPAVEIAPSTTTSNPPARPFGLPVILTLAALATCILWNMWPIFYEMGRRWSLDPTYSHGYLIPLISFFLLWSRRDSAPSVSQKPHWWSLPLFLLGAAVQLAGAWFDIDWLCGSALLFYLAGIATLLGGWPTLKWVAPAIGFLVFMIPLPFKIEVLMRGPMRRLSTLASTFVLQTFGISAVSEGNVILLNDVQGKTVELGVVDACSGLKMFIVFVALCTAVALLVKRPWIDRLLILLSAAPIAMICNIIRISITGVLYATVGSRLAELVFHDLAGWLMMPMALALLWLELRLIDNLFPPVETIETKRILQPAGFNLPTTGNKPQKK